MVNLDKKASFIQTSDQIAALESINRLPQQLSQAFQEIQKINFPYSYRQAKNVVVCGMGGSRFPALVIKELFKEEIIVPFLVNDDYNVPGFVNKDSLVILSSYSGTTEEVIFCGQEAHRRRANITAITSGGDLSLLIKKINAPGYVFNPIHNPSRQPRMGFGYFVGALMGLLLRLKLINADSGYFEAAIKKLPYLGSDFKTDSPTAYNPAKSLAQQLCQKYPYYIVGEFLTGVGNAIANQTNETAKSISSFRVIPELNHHLMEGLKFPDVLRENACFVFFFSDLYSSPIKKRFLITKEVVQKNKIQTVWIKLKGENKTEQAFRLMAFGSYLSMYLSVLYKQNPSLIPYVDYFKKRLKETN